MYRPSDFGIRGHLTGLLAGTESLPAFYRWFVDAIHQAESEADEATWDLFLAVENVLAEWTGGYLGNDAALQALRSLTPPRAVLPSEEELRVLAARRRADTQAISVGRPNADSAVSRLSVVSAWAA
jgi:hypothetical protein